VELIHSRDALSRGSPQHPPCWPQMLPYRYVKTTPTPLQAWAKWNHFSPGNHHPCAHGEDAGLSRSTWGRGWHLMQVWFSVALRLFICVLRSSFYQAPLFNHVFSTQPSLTCHRQQRRSQTFRFGPTHRNLSSTTRLRHRIRKQTNRSRAP
jgi:hypothetical protein